jgi:hypothetical protein
MEKHELKFLAKNIVNQLFDVVGVPVEKRQLINDNCDAFVEKCIENYLNRAPAEQKGDEPKSELAIIRDFLYSELAGDSFHSGKMRLDDIHELWKKLRPLICKPEQKEAGHKNGGYFYIPEKTDCIKASLIISICTGDRPIILPVNYISNL